MDMICVESCKSVVAKVLNSAEEKVHCVSKNQTTETFYYNFVKTKIGTHNLRDVIKLQLQLGAGDIMLSRYPSMCVCISTVCE